MIRAAAAPALALLALLLPLPAPAAEAPPLAADPLAAQARSEKKALIADFGLGICATCKQQMKVLDNIDADYRGRVVIRFVHVNKESALADFHGVTEVPTLLFYLPDGTISLRQVGGMNYLQVADQLEKMGLKP